MKFSVEPGPFIRMLELLAEGQPGPEPPIPVLPPGRCERRHTSGRVSRAGLLPVRMPAPPRRGRPRARRAPEAHEVLSLVACGGRVSVQQHKRTAEIEAAVWAEGGCTVDAVRFLATLKGAWSKVPLTIEASVDGLRVGALALPLLDFCPSVVVPSTSQIFLATDLGVVSSRPSLAET